jgi:methylmalonyl-CoA carboxyltransferase large subunit
MQTESVDLARVVDMLEALRQEIARLSERVAALEQGAATKSAVVPAPAVAAAPAAEGLSEELILVIGAAVAAYLGKKAPIRQIRLLGSAGWAQQGRLTVQASHTLKG